MAATAAAPILARTNTPDMAGKILTDSNGRLGHELTWDEAGRLVFSKPVTASTSASQDTIRITGLAHSTGEVTRTGDIYLPLAMTTGEQRFVCGNHTISGSVSTVTVNSNEIILRTMGTGGSSVTMSAGTGGTISVDASGVLSWYGIDDLFTEQCLKQAMSHRIKQNLLIRMNHRCRSLDSGLTPQEQKARDTLRDLITEKEWRRYVTNGFIMVRGASGFWYQIFNKRSERVSVFKDGKKTHCICIHSDNICPPTDHVINMKVMIEIDGMEIWRNGNVANQQNQRINAAAVNAMVLNSRESILDTYRRLKGRTIRVENNVVVVPPVNALLNSTWSVTNNTLALAC